MSAAIRRHARSILVITFLALAMTFPTIVYVFRTDVFWLPEDRSQDIFIEFWNIWYGRQVLSGQADYFYTDTIFYPRGVSLTYHPLFLLEAIAVSALNTLLPISNALSLLYILVALSNALAAYFYIFWLFKDKWLALFGACIFGFSPQVLGYPAWLKVIWIAPLPLILYFLHRGLSERRGILVFLAGLGAGLTSMVVQYFFVCALISTGVFVLGMSASRWRDRQFWRHIAMLALAVVLAAAWRVTPMLQDLPALDRATADASRSVAGDLMSFFINKENPITRPLLEGLFQIPSDGLIGHKSYLGFLPLTLTIIGLADKRTRRKAWPWLGLLLVFLLLRLGSTLRINGVEFESVKLPKYYLDNLLPFVFGAYYQLPFFMAGAWLPLAILSCFGLRALRGRAPVWGRPAIVILLIIVVAVEYYRPFENEPPRYIGGVTESRTAFVDWLAREPGKIRLVNLPFAWINSRIFSYYQTLHGYPQTEGAISRTPAYAYDYIRANYVLRSWLDHRPVHCETADRQAYLAAISEMEADEFSHVILHRDLYGASHVEESFDGIPAAYNDQNVSIYRLKDLRESCPQEPSDRHFFASAYAETLGKTEILDERGSAVILSPTKSIAEHFIRFLRHNRLAEMEVSVVSTDSTETVVSGSDRIVQETTNAVWLLDDRRYPWSGTPEATQAWLLERFKPCNRIYENGVTTIDLLLRLDVPCSAMDSSSALEIRYLDGLRLHNASVETRPEKVLFYFAWTNRTSEHYSFSIQFFGEDGQRALQRDSVIKRELLTRVEIDTSQLPAGRYVVKLIAYEFETGKSQSGTVESTMEQFEREYELATIEL
ncbi:MAG: hypothetical protein OXI30_02910 [Chloroflexota bacterium]|nr:hypothetical protein [Chloroflexota bacterium]